MVNFPRDLHALRLGPTPEVRTIAGSPLEERGAAMSPDGLWLVYEAETPGRPGELELFALSFQDPGRSALQLTKDGGMFPVWRRNGRDLELNYTKPDGRLVSMRVEANTTTWKAASPVELFRGPYLMFGEGSMGRQYDVTADGRFLMIKETLDARATSHFVVVQNWVAELQGLPGK